MANAVTPVESSKKKATTRRRTREFISVVCFMSTTANSRKFEVNEATHDTEQLARILASSAMRDGAVFCRIYHGKKQLYPVAIPTGKLLDVMA